MRSRNIKPAFFKNEDLGSLPPETRLLFIGLWCLADREGRLEDRPARIKVEAMPWDSLDISKALTDLDSKKLIVRYEVEGKKYIYIPNFNKHQSPHVRESKSTIPLPRTILGQSKAKPRTIQDSLNPDVLNPDVLNPDKQKEMSLKFSKPTPEEVTSYARTLGYQLAGATFCDFYESKGWKVGNTPMKNWKAAVRTWKTKHQEDPVTIGSDWRKQ